ncbi:MAG: hypothetical protein AAGE01_00300 [Pseudomonadota bacterium]
MATIEAREARPDFSPKAINRAVLKESTQHPTVLYPAGAAVIGGLAAIALGPGLVALGAMAAGGVIATSGLLINRFARRDFFASRYVRKLREQALNRHSELLEFLKKGLKQIDSELGYRQLQRVQEKFDAYQEVLGGKFKPHTLTYSRYLGIAEQVYFAVLDNLNRIVGVSRSIAAIDVEYSRRRIAELEAGAVESDAARNELATLRQRLELDVEQRARIEDWLAANEVAMTQLDTTAMTLATVETTQGLAKVNLETAMDELQRLAANTAAYDRAKLKS